MEYEDKRIEDLVFKLLSETDHFGSETDSISNQEKLVRVLDKRTLKESTWVGLVLRHIPRTPQVPTDILKSFNNSLSGFTEAGATGRFLRIEESDIYPPQDI